MKIKLNFIYLIIFPILVVVIAFFGNYIYQNSKISMIDIKNNSFKISFIININENRVKYLERINNQGNFLKILGKIDDKYFFEVTNLGKTNVESLTSIIDLTNKKPKIKENLFSNNVSTMSDIYVGYGSFINNIKVPNKAIQNILFYSDGKEITKKLINEQEIEIYSECSSLNLFFNNVFNDIILGQGQIKQKVFVTFLRANDNTLYFIRLSSSDYKSISLSQLIKQSQ